MGRPRILVIEDNPIVLKMVRACLRRENYEILEATNARSALEVANSTPPNLILQDLVLPDMDGFELVERLRDVEGCREAPILAFTGYLPRLDEARAMSRGFDDFVVKPVEPARLLRIIASYLQEPSAVGGDSGRDRKILIVDDDPIQLKSSRALLSHVGFQVQTALDGAEALEKARTDPPEIILADTFMTKLDGFNLCWAVRNDPKIFAIPVVLISPHYVEDEDRELARNVGANDLVSRTPRLELVIESVAKSLDQEPPACPIRLEGQLREEYQRRVLRQLERQVAVNAKLLERSVLNAAALAVLGGISERLTHDRDVETSLGEALGHCLNAAGVSRGALYLTGANGALDLRASVGLDPESEARARDHFGQPDLFRSLVAEGAGPIMLPSRESAWNDVLAAMGVPNAHLLPLEARGKSLGLLVLADRTNQLETSEWIPFARTLASQLGQAIALAREFERVSAAEHRYRRLFEMARDPVFLATTEGTVLEVNRRWEETFDAQGEEARGRSVLEWIPADGDLASGSATVRLPSPDGTLAIVEFSLSLIDIGDERLILGIGRMVTERVPEQARLSLA